MPSSEIMVGVQVVYFTSLGVSEFAPQVLMSHFRVDVGHHTIGELQLSGGVHEVTLEVLLRAIDDDTGEFIVGLLRQMRRGQAYVFGINGARVLCRVREVLEPNGRQPKAIWRATVDGLDEPVELIGTAALETDDQLAEIERAVVHALESRSSIPAAVFGHV